MKKTLCIFLFFMALAANAQQNDWKYIQVDDERTKWGDYDDPSWLRYFGLWPGDVNHDGYEDIVAGRYIYLNPGGDMTGKWQRVDFGMNVDGMILTDIDGDEYADVIAEALPEIWWLEASGTKALSWKAMVIGKIPPTTHVNGQGFELADIIEGGRPEVLLSGEGGVYAAEIPAEPETEWNFNLIAESGSEEGIGTGDLDGDGDVDMAIGFVPEGEEEPVELRWFENPGKTDQLWKWHSAGKSEHAIDRVEIADLDGDNKNDIVVSEERYPGKEPDANLFWYENNGSWTRHHLYKGYSLNNLDVADADLDGDQDIISNEHKGEEHKTTLFLNDGKGQFIMEVIDRGKESHLGTRFSDLDLDGDPDLISAGWDNYRFLHLWRNDQINNKLKWRHLSTLTNDLELPNPGNEQTSSLLLDIDKDNIPEFFITERTEAPAVVMYKKEGDSWKRYVIEDNPLRIEAGSAHYDIDGDGDEDIVFGGESRSNKVWWWENPYPDFDPQESWKRYTIKNSGSTKHHDQIFGDFDGDGESEIVFWNQSEGKLFFAEVPENPKKQQEWDLKVIYHYYMDSQMKQAGQEGYPGWKGTNEQEGLAAIDIDGDGTTDIVGGGRWFKHLGEGRFSENIIDASYTFTRSAAGQFIEGGRPEVVLVAGDGMAPMYMYEYQEGTWFPKVLIPEVDNGHTIDVLDFNGDGHLDIFTAEMRLGNGNKDAKTMILLGDGKGNFKNLVLFSGFGNHESRIGDLDGDGDYDVLGKPYNWEAPRLDIWINESEN